MNPSNEGPESTFTKDPLLYRNPHISLVTALQCQEVKNARSHGSARSSGPAHSAVSTFQAISSFAVK